MKPIEPINFTRGDTYRFDFSFPLDGAKYKLNAGDVIRLFVFKGRQKVITKFLSIANQGADGTITVVFNPEDTSSLRPGTYEYERELITADGRTETIHRMPFIIYEDLITPENRGANDPPSSEPQAWLQARSVLYENTRSSLRSKNLQAAVDEIDGKLRDIEIPERSEIISTGIGSSIVLDCASDRHLRGLTLYGKTTQNGIPSPTNPIPLVSAGEGGSITVNISDGTSGNNQTLTVQTPNGLPGVPVTSGGNYADENGQQWICDEIGLERGVYVQRTGVYTDDGRSSQWKVMIKNDNTIIFSAPTPCRLIENVKQLFNMQEFNWNISLTSRHNSGAIGPTGIMYCICSVADFPDVAAFTAHLSETPIECIYPLATPTETPLSAAEIAAYKALTTNRPNTTILNDGGAGMDVTYVPDNPAAIYLDKRLSDIEAAIISTGGNI